MHILSIHNTYQIRGGEDESRAAEENLLRAQGHQVDIYEESNDRIAQISPVSLALRTIWSATAYQTVRQHLSKTPIDLIHVQNFFPLISPSVYYAARHSDVPVVQTLRNYRLICPNGLFFRDGGVCEDCLGKFIPYPGVLHACYRESRTATGVTAAMLAVHRTLRTWLSQVNVFITLSEFARQKFIAAGLPGEKIFVKPNFVASDPGMGSGSGDYVLYVGRLSVEKGLDTLLAAWKSLKAPVTLKIIGDGPLSEQVRQAARDMENVEWLGRQSLQQTYDLMGEAMVLVFPSKWYETFGRVAIEAFAKGTPVIASNIGAIAELVASERTGWLFQPGNAGNLAAQIDWAISHPQQRQAMRIEARKEFERFYTAAANYQKLMEIYQVAGCM
jgi:glycosyltransferase involved in cell wall biosynthesis